jgi:hypothetical protein
VAHPNKRAVVQSVPHCTVCGMGFRNSHQCSNGCCFYCHAIYCDPCGDTIDLEKARAMYRDFADAVKEVLGPGHPTRRNYPAR